MSIQQYRPGGFKLLPDVVKNLLIINGIMFLATVVLSNSGIDLNDILGLHYVESEKFHWYQFITYMFMHGNLGHIGFNMLALWMFGSQLENVWGPQKFLKFYLLTGLGAAVTYYAVVYYELQPILTTLNDYIANHDYEKLKGVLQSEDFNKYASVELKQFCSDIIDKYSSMIDGDSNKALDLSVKYMSELKMDVLNAPVVVGASGAIFGLLLAFGMLFPDSLIYLYLFLPIKAKYFVIIYGAAEFIYGVANRPGDNVAHFAHVGGLVTGFIIMMYWRDQNRRRRNDYFNP